MLDNTDFYAKPHGSGEGGGGNTIIYNINNSGGNAQILNVQNITANQADITNLTTLSATINNADIDYLTVDDAQIHNLTGDTLNFDSGNINDLTCGNITTNGILVKDTATINTLKATNINSTNITTDYLQVNKSAHFFEVIVDKMRSVQGIQINTAANCIADCVVPYNSNDEVVAADSNDVSYYRVFFRTRDDNGRAITNDWLTLDQAICQSFNVQQGTTTNTGNKYYWRKLVLTNNDTGQTIKYVNYDIDGNMKNISDTEKSFSIEFNNLAYSPFKFEITDSEAKGYGSYATTFDVNTNPSGKYNAYTFIPTNVQDTLIVTPAYEGTPLSHGTFSFSTVEPCRLSIGINYDNGDFQYVEAPEIAKTNYSVETLSEGAITNVEIHSAVIETWHACHWIDLSNSIKDTDTSLGYSIPEAGDNIAQLGYRYTELDGYENTQAWRDTHKDEIARASAIIIAAYNTPDSGGTYGGRTYPPIYPPSYAQYQNITDYTLFRHRGTYMDATGGYFAGNLVSESGNIINIDDQLSVDVDYYSIIPEENPITKPTNTKTVNFKVLHVLNGEGEIVNATDIQNLTLNVNGTSYTATQNHDYFTVTVTSSMASLNCQLYLDNVLKDQLVISVIDFDTVTDGVNGDYTDFVYHGSNSSITAPALPTNVNYSWDGMSSAEKNGWTKTTPTGFKYVWMTQRDNTGTQGGWTYGNWTTAICITGEDGQNGVDGDYLEYIYARTKQERIWGSSDNDNPINWSDDPDFNNDDYIPSAYTHLWFDNPQGLGNSYLYEYVSTRTKHFTANSYMFGDYSAPVLWSKYGENGMDGDGVEYVFTSYEGATLPNDRYPNYTSYHGKSFTDDDFVPQGWADDPMSPTSTYTYVFVSQRKQKNGEWVVPSSGETGTPWSTPAVWSKYAKDGNPGQTGPQGNPGTNGTVDKLVPYITRFEVRTTSTEDYSDIVSKLYANLQYQVWHADGNTVSQVTNPVGSGYSIRAYVRSISNPSVITFNFVISAGTAGFTQHDNMFKLFNGNASYEITNVLDYLPSAVSTDNRDYRKLSQSNQANAYLPIEIQVELLYNNQVVDSKIHEVIFKAGHVFEVTDAALNSAFFGSWTKDGQTVNGMSQIHQDMSGISSQVSTLSTNLTGLQSDYSTFKQTSTQFQTNVTNQISTINGDITTLSSTINQTANSIKLGVYEQSTMGDNLFKKPDFPTNWNSETERWMAYNRGTTEVTTPSTIGISRETRTAYMHNNHTSIAIDMAYDMSGHVFSPDIRQNIYDSSYIPAGTNIMMSMYVKMQPAENQTTAANSVIGMDIYVEDPNQSDDVLYQSSESIVLYIDNKYYNNGSTSTNKYGCRSWAQIGGQDVKDTNWHYFQYMCKTKVDLKLSDIRARIFGWHSGTDDTTPQTIDYAKQPIFYVSEPVFSIDNSGVTNDRIKSTGIDIEQGKITLQADKVTFTNSAGTVDDKISIDPTTGTLRAVNGEFSGVITANTTYSPFVEVGDSDYTGTYYDINPSVGSNFWALPPSDYNTSHYLRLPSAATCSGYKVTIFCIRQDRRALHNILINSVGIRYLEPQYKLTYEENTALVLACNTFIEVIAIGNYWYVIKGRFSVDGGSTWIDI